MSEGRLMGFEGGQLYKFLHFETVNLLQRNKNTRTITNKRAFLARTPCLLHPLKRWICPKSQDLGHFFVQKFLERTRTTSLQGFKYCLMYKIVLINEVQFCPLSLLTKKFGLPA
jgi:hypothetical protein